MSRILKLILPFIAILPAIAHAADAEIGGVRCEATSLERSSGSARASNTLIFEASKAEGKSLYTGAVGKAVLKPGTEGPRYGLQSFQARSNDPKGMLGVDPIAGARFSVEVDGESAAITVRTPAGAQTQILASEGGSDGFLVAPIEIAEQNRVIDMTLHCRVY